MIIDESFRVIRVFDYPRFYCIQSSRWKLFLYMVRNIFDSNLLFLNNQAILLTVVSFQHIQTS